MEDREIVAAIAAGDPAGIADAYDTYAGSVYGYCRWMLGEPADAAEVVRDTFGLAAAEAGGLGDPSTLRSWLFATARGECLRRPSAVRGVPPAETEGALGPAGADNRAAERADLRALVRATLAELAPEKREAVELSVWHDLDDADLAAVFGVSRPEAYALAASGRSQLEKALGTLRIAQTGRAACPELGTMLADWNGRLTIETLHLASRHIGRCAACESRRRGTLRTEAFSRLLPLPALPAGLRDRVLEPGADMSQGIPATAALAGWSRIRDHPRVAVAAAAVVAAAISIPVLAAGGTHVTRSGIGTVTNAAASVGAGGTSASGGATGGASSGGVSAGTGPSGAAPPVTGGRPTAPTVPSASASGRPSPRKSQRPTKSAPPTASPSSSSAPPSPRPSPTPTRTPTHSPTPTPTHSPSPTHSPTPSSSPSKSPSPTPA
jgi:RNA polymerase sigma factor (sigma-70 family)